MRDREGIVMLALFQLARSHIILEATDLEKMPPLSVIPVQSKFRDWEYQSPPRMVPYCLITVISSRCLWHAAMKSV